MKPDDKAAGRTADEPEGGHVVGKRLVTVRATVDVDELVAALDEAARHIEAARDTQVVPSTRTRARAGA